MSELPEAGTHYNDIRGTAALDWRPSETSLNDFCSQMGMDTEGYYPVGLGLYQSAEGAPGDEKILRVDIYVVAITPESDQYENYVEYAMSKGGELPVVKFRATIPIEDFFKFPKQFSVFLNALHRSPQVTGYDVTDARELDM